MGRELLGALAKALRDVLAIEANLAAAPIHAAYDDVRVEVI
jgi:hypothetical protein